MAGAGSDLPAVVFDEQGRGVLPDQSHSWQQCAEEAVPDILQRDAGDRLLGCLQLGHVPGQAEVPAPPVARPEPDSALPQSRRGLAGILPAAAPPDPGQHAAEERQRRVWNRVGIAGNGTPCQQGGGACKADQAHSTLELPARGAFFVPICQSIGWTPDGIQKAFQSLGIIREAVLLKPINSEGHIFKPEA